MTRGRNVVYGNSRLLVCEHLEFRAELAAAKEFKQLDS